MSSRCRSSWCSSPRSMAGGWSRVDWYERSTERLQQLAAIHRDGLAGDPGRERGRQKQRHVGDFLGMAQTAERDRIQHGVIKPRIVGFAPIPDAAGKLDRSGSDAIYPYAVFGVQR